METEELFDPPTLNFVRTGSGGVENFGLNVVRAGSGGVEKPALNIGLVDSGGVEKPALNAERPGSGGVTLPPTLKTDCAELAVFNLPTGLKRVGSGGVELA